MSSLRPLTDLRVPWKKANLYVLLFHRMSCQLLINFPESRRSNDPDKSSRAP